MALSRVKHLPESATPRDMAQRTSPAGVRQQHDPGREHCTGRHGPPVRAAATPGSGSGTERVNDGAQTNLYVKNRRTEPSNRLHSGERMVSRPVRVQPSARLRTGVKPEVHHRARRTLDGPLGTPDPAPEAPEPARGRSYVVQSSTARRSWSKCRDGRRRVRNHMPWSRPPFRRTR